MVKGTRLWLEDGLNPPERVKAATTEYLESADAISRSLDERCVFGVNESVTKAKAFESWKAWAAAAGGVRRDATPAV